MDDILHTPQNKYGADGAALEQKRPLGQRLRARMEALAGGARRITPVGGLIAAAVVTVAAAAIVSYTPSYAVSVGETQLGAVADKQTVEQVVERVEQRVSEILGCPYTLDDEISCGLVLARRDEVQSAAQLERFLMDRVDGIMQGYVLKVDGQVIGAAKDPAVLDALLEEIQAPYRTQDTTACTFTSDVTIAYGYAPADTNQDTAAMAQTLTANTNGETLYEVQAGDTFMQIAWDNNMTVSEMQALNPDVDTEVIYIGQLLTVKEEIPFLSVQTVDRVTYHEAIACPVEEIEDGTMYRGDTRVLQAGVEGDSLVTADVSYVNGKERARTVVETEVLSEPTARVIAVGTKERPSWYPNGYFIWPVYGNITSQFGYRSIFGSGNYHRGIDIAAPYGTTISAADGGTVVWSGTGTGSYWSYGKYVVIDHGNGKQTYYAHCSSLLVSAGDHVYQGQPIAGVGSTGRSTGNHCHFEVKLNGTSVNPLSYL